MVDFITGRRILIVDDQMLIALAIAEELEAEGALIVGPASSLQTALAFLISERVDAAVLDIRLGDSPVYPVADALIERCSISLRHRVRSRSPSCPIFTRAYLP